MEEDMLIVIGTLRLECLMLEFDGRRYLANAMFDDEEGGATSCYQWVLELWVSFAGR